jgi:methionine-S-sulfoxide reductase
MNGMTRRAMYLTLAAVMFGCAPNIEADTPPKAPATKDGPREVAILGAGCFWGVEHWMNKASGVVDIEVGYAGGRSSKVTYEQVSDGETGHAEVVRIVFDPSVISYEDLLAKWFFKIHDPTTKDRQGNDVGSQYRSVIIPTTDAQKKAATTVMARIEKSGAWKKPLSTTIEANQTWVKAEDYHQDYLVKNPGGYDNHYLRKLEF